MGFQSQSKVLYKSTDVSFDLIVHLVTKRFEISKGRGECGGRSRPKVTIDANLIGYQFISRPCGPVGALRILSRCLSDNYIDVVIIADGPTRHHSKRATVNRHAERLDATLKRIELAELLRNETDDSTQAISKLNLEIKRSKSKFERILPLTFVDQLKKLVQPSENGKGCIDFISSLFQADPEIAGLAISGSVDAIISGDSDFSLHIGPGRMSAHYSRDCSTDSQSVGTDFMLQNPKISIRNSSVESMSLVTGQMFVRDHSQSILNSRVPAEYFPVTPTVPLLNQEKDHMIRMLIGIALGCDVLVGGIKGFGPTDCEKLLSSVRHLPKDQQALQFASKLASHKKSTIRDKDVFLCLAESLLFEKTTYGYMHHPPQKLFQYNVAFATSETIILNDGPIVRECKGTDNMPHKFLEAEGYSECVDCKEVLCRHCLYKNHGNEGSSFCMDCARSPECSEVKTEDQMRLALADVHGVTVPATATYSEVLELYDCSKCEEGHIFSKSSSEVKYPLEPSGVLHSSSVKITPIKTTKLIHFRDLIGDMNAVSIKQVADLFHLLCSLLKNNEHTTKETKFAYEKIMPLNLINFAKSARIHEGHRLCKRAVRHATDPASPNIIESGVTLALYGSELCLVLAHKVRASMKSLVYCTKTCFSHKDLIATECTCKAGCRNGKTIDRLGTEKILCTHGLTLPTQLSIFLYQGLAEHLLVELRNRLLISGGPEYVQVDSVIFREDIKLLMSAAGQSIKGLSSRDSLLDWLKTFSVATDLSKHCPGRANPKDWRLLREIRFEEPTTKCMRIVSNESRKPKGGIVVDLSIPHVKHSYNNTKLLVDAVTVCLNMFFKQSVLPQSNKRQNVIGFKLLQFRAVNDESDFAIRHEAVQALADKLRNILLSKNIDSIQRTNVPEPSAAVTTELRATTPLCLPKKKSISNCNLVTPSPKKKRSPLVEISNNVPCSSSSLFSQTQKKRRRDRTCCVNWCDGRGTNCIPKPGPLPISASARRRESHAIKTLERRETLDRLGYKRIDGRDLRWCDAHPTEWVTKSCSYQLGGTSSSGEANHMLHPQVKNITHKFQCPKQTARKSHEQPSSSKRKGLGSERQHFRNVQERMGLDLHAVNEFGGPNLIFHEIISENPNRSEPQQPSQKVGILDLTSLVPSVVHRRTGFEDLVQLLSFTAVVCGGSFELTTKTVTTKLSFMEEWFLYFEWMYHRSRTRFEDLTKDYNVSYKTAKRVFRSKLQIAMCARSRWPAYALHEEDKKFRAEHWNEHFNDKTRVVMHDNTNVPLPAPSDAALNRATHLDYYGECCAKGGAALQLCGWIRALELCTGSIPDTSYIDLVKVLKEQKEFAESDVSTENGFLNIFDKGYRCTLAALKEGQKCCQPDFAQSDKQFSRDSTLHSAGVAVVRSGNERAVKTMKLSWQIRNGVVSPNQDLRIVAGHWLAWGFQVNFMYSTVL